MRRNAPVFEPQSIRPPVVTLHQQRVSVPSGIRSSQVAAPSTLQNGLSNFTVPAGTAVPSEKKRAK
ncbi:hypothetical protein BDR26DRAFT_1004429 [Obelidium mucronatum]|nr:hypothetical protein BDR26DRAFT_1004429 [Obelidium mucronatum]